MTTLTYLKKCPIVSYQGIELSVQITLPPPPPRNWRYEDLSKSRVCQVMMSLHPAVDLLLKFDVRSPVMIGDINIL